MIDDILILPKVAKRHSYREILGIVDRLDDQHGPAMKPIPVASR
jgi:hypothetical protein